MASLEMLFRQVGRSSTRLYLGNRTLSFLQHFTYSSSSDQDSKDPSTIKIVSYPPVKPKDPPVDSNADRPVQRQASSAVSSRVLPSQQHQQKPSETEEDSNTRPWTREESRYMKDAPIVPVVSYPVKVAPLPEDKIFPQQQEEIPADGSPRVQVGRRAQLEREARRMEAQMRLEEVDENIPFPKMVVPERKGPKVLLDLNDAIREVKANAKCRFDETVEVHVLLGVNPKRGDQMVRGGAPLPHGIGKPIKVAVFAEAAAANEARAAGADIVGGDELVEEIKEGGLKRNFDKCIATPAFMPRLGKIAKILGPRGLMPNPKAGTVTNDVAEAVREAKRGRVDFKMDKTAIVHAGLGKVSFKEEALRDNIAVFVNALLAAKPVGLKNTSKYAGYFKTFTLTSTMGPGFRVSIQSLSQAADQYMKLRVQ